VKTLLLCSFTFFASALCAPVSVIAQSRFPADFVLVKGGIFTMGSPVSEPERGTDETQHHVGGDLFEIQCVTPYSSNCNTCLDEALRDQRANARPALKTHVSNMAQYDVVLLGYPNWWASIPAPIASFLDEYDLAGKTIIPFCSHGGGRFGQSLTAIAKLEPRAKIGDALSVHYSGGSSLANDITAWLRKNGITARN
jgi:flavodoxin